MIAARELAAHSRSSGSGLWAAWPRMAATHRAPSTALSVRVALRMYRARSR